MQTVISRSAFRTQPPPLWFVTNGDKTVGPVLTDVLVRGVRYGRVHPECSVRIARQVSWRPVTAVRELTAVASISPRRPLDPLAGMARLLEGIRDEDERLHFTAQMSLLVTGADAGMLHFAKRPGAVPLTRCVLGPVSDARMGRPLAASDRLFLSARAGQPIFGGPEDGLAHHSLAARFVGEDHPRGVAMIPLMAAGQLLGLLELARSDRRLRRADLIRAETLCRYAVRRYQN